MLLWLPAGLGTIACVSAAVVFGLRYRGQEAQPSAASGLSVIVPVKGADPAFESNMDALLSSRLPVPVEYLIAMESADDPAHAVAERVRGRYSDVVSSIVISGPAGQRMGKQHNLAVAAAAIRYDTIASMDADVRVEPDTLALGLRHLAQPEVGVAYFLPQYRGPGRAGGLLVALYSNYYYQLNMGALALSRNAPFITGGLWLMSGEARRRIGGLAEFGGTLSDDAAIGRAVVAVGLRNVLVPRTVHIKYEDLDLAGGCRHVLKWLALLRAEGLATYLAIALSWHPLLLAAVTAVITILAGGSPALAALFVGLAALVRLGSGLVLHTRAYAWRGVAALLWLPAYELVAVPILFTRGLFAKHLTWGGIRYRIGRRGVIMSATPAD
jgi:ceramide glucosyltransferase